MKHTVQHPVLSSVYLLLLVHIEKAKGHPDAMASTQRKCFGDVCTVTRPRADPLPSHSKSHGRLQYCLYKRKKRQASKHKSSCLERSSGDFLVAETIEKGLRLPSPTCSPPSWLDRRPLRGTGLAFFRKPEVSGEFRGSSSSESRARSNRMSLQAK